MSKVWARRLIAGTVKPDTSPRARASYSPWMLAERAPRTWLASQISHCAASMVASSIENAAVQARSRIPASRKCGLVVDDEPVAVEVGAARQASQQVGWGCRDVGHGVRVSSKGSERPWYRPLESTAQEPFGPPGRSFRPPSVAAVDGPSPSSRAWSPSGSRSRRSVRSGACPPRCSFWAVARISGGGPAGTPAAGGPGGGPPAVRWTIFSMAGAWTNAAYRIAIR